MEKETKKGKGTIYRKKKKIGEANYQITAIPVVGFIGFMGGQDSSERTEEIYGYLTNINAKNFNEDDEFVLRLADGSRVRFKAIDYYPPDKTSGMKIRGSIMRKRSRKLQSENN